MDRFVSLDLRPTPEADARIPAFSAAAFYGKGISTTIAIVDGRPFLWDKHRERLIRDADRLCIDPSNLSEDRLLAALSEILRKNERTEGRARITLFENNAGGPWSSGDRSQPTTLITTAGRRPAREMRVSASRYTVNSTSPLTGIKSCNYLEPLMALEEAKS